MRKITKKRIDEWKIRKEIENRDILIEIIVFFISGLIIGRFF